MSSIEDDIGAMTAGTEDLGWVNEARLFRLERRAAARPGLALDFQPAVAVTAVHAPGAAAEPVKVVPGMRGVCLTPVSREPRPLDSGSAPGAGWGAESGLGVVGSRLESEIGALRGSCTWCTASRAGIATPARAGEAQAAGAQHPPRPCAAEDTCDTAGWPSPAAGFFGVRGGAGAGSRLGEVPSDVPFLSIGEDGGDGACGRVTGSRPGTRVRGVQRPRPASGSAEARGGTDHFGMNSGMACSGIRVGNIGGAPSDCAPATLCRQSAATACEKRSREVDAAVDSAGRGRATVRKSSRGLVSDAAVSGVARDEQVGATGAARVTGEAGADGSHAAGAAAATALVSSPPILGRSAAHAGEEGGAAPAACVLSEAALGSEENRLAAVSGGVDAGHERTGRHAARAGASCGSGALAVAGCGVAAAARAACGVGAATLDFSEPGHGRCLELVSRAGRPAVASAADRPAVLRPAGEVEVVLFGAAAGRNPRPATPAGGAAAAAGRGEAPRERWAELQAWEAAAARAAMLSHGEALLAAAERAQAVAMGKVQQRREAQCAHSKMGRQAGELPVGAA